MGTIFLTPVDDPRRYGLVDLREDGAVASFLEKPGEWEGPALINAGVYVLEPEVLEMIPRGRLFSIERGVFPKLAAAGSLYGYVDHGYWRDIGTPDSYLQAHFDILERRVDTSIGDALGEQYLYIAPSAEVAADASVVPPCYIAATAQASAPEPGSGRWRSSATAPWSATERRSRGGDPGGCRHRRRRPGSREHPCARIEHRRRGAAQRRRARRGLRDRRRNRLAGGICVYPDTELPDNSIQFYEQLRGREGA